MEPPDALRVFRRSFYEHLHRTGDALFELADAILPRTVPPLLPLT